ncbi:MAG: YciI-like protein [Gammaproteobacteria bacterium]|nr:hypothetical protein [Gammaproteobacteria bacterium]
MHYVLMYEFAPDYLQRRAAWRDEHLRLAWAAHERGELVLGGAFADPPDRGMLLFECESPDIPLRFAQADPYVKNGLVVRHTVRAWTTVVGKEAAHPIRPIEAE